MLSSQWLQSLFNNLEQTKCRIGRENVSFDDACSKVSELILDVRSAGKRVYWVGNGGSSALCAHLSQDLMNKLDVRSLVFNDASLLTCMANDYGYENVYSIPLSKHLEEGDLLIAVSSSGNSKNIISSVDLAHRLGANTVTLSAFNAENALFNVSGSDVSFWLPCSLYGHAEVGHEAILHALIETLYLSQSKAK